MLLLLQLLRDPMRDHRDLRVRVLACMLQSVFLAVPLPLPLPLLCPSSSPSLSLSLSLQQQTPQSWRTSLYQFLSLSVPHTPSQ
jgi:hypothetical protein